MTRKLAALVAGLCTAWLLVLPIGALYLLIDIDTFASLAVSNLPLPIQWYTVSNGQWFALWGVTALYLALGFAGAWYLRLAFQSFARGEWFDAENSRHLRRYAMQASPPATAAEPASPGADPEAFAWRALSACWAGDRRTFDALYAPYCVLHRSPVDYCSGRDELLSYYRTLDRALGGATVSVDHVAAQPFAGDGVDIAVRWTAAGHHEGQLLGVEPGGNPLFILGVTHWRCIAGRIAVEMTVFDDLALLSQTMA